MKIEPIDVSRIRGRWTENNEGYVSGGDDTVVSIQIVAVKVNDIIERLNLLEKIIAHHK